MHRPPVVHVGRPNTVQLSGSTTIKTLKAIYNWSISGFDICPEYTESIPSPLFSHPNSSKWRMELVKDDGSPRLCFCLVASQDAQPVKANLKADVIDKEGVKHTVYPLAFCTLGEGEKSPLKCLMESYDVDNLGNVWSFECEVSIQDVVLEDTSDEAKEEIQSAVAMNLRCLLDSKCLTDITLDVGGVQLKAHRVILCARSLVFEAMLRHDTKEAQDGCVKIPDVKPEVMSEVLHYMYTGQVRVPSDMAEKLLAAADKYGLNDVKFRCEVELARQLTVDSAAIIALYAVLHSCSFLQKACAAFISQNLEQVVGSKGWTDIIDKYPTVVKRISKFITEGSERYSSPLPRSESQSDASTVNSSAMESVSDYKTAATGAGNTDTVWDSGYTHCERKKVIYVWTVSGLSNWPQEKKYVVSPCFCHPDTIQWQLKLYKNGKEFYVRYQLLKNKDGAAVAVDLNVSVIPSEGEKSLIRTSKDCILREGSEAGERFECGLFIKDVLMLECEISTVSLIQQWVGGAELAPQSSLTQDLGTLLESGNVTDFKLCVGGVETGVHRAVLAARSPVFARMLQSEMDEVKSGRLEVPDVKPKVLSKLLRYIYTGRVENLSDTAGDLLAAAHRYELPMLKSQCGEYLGKQLSEDNAVAAAVCAVENQCDSLLDLSVAFIKQNFKKVMGTAGWSEAIDMHPAAVKRISQLVAGGAKRSTDDPEE